MSGSHQEKPTQSFGADIRASLTLIREKLWLIALCVLVFGIAGVAYLTLTPKVYRAQAVIQVTPGERNVLKEDGIDVQELQGEEITKTIEQSLTSPELLLNLIDRNQLNKDPAFLPELKRPVSGGKMAEELAKHISAQVRRSTRLIDIKVEDRSPIIAQKITELLVKEFIRNDLRRHMEASEAVYNFFLQQADRLKGKLAKSEEALQAYKEQHQAVVLGEKENIALEKLGELNRMVTEAKGLRLKLESDYARIKKLGNGPPTLLLAIPSIASSPAIVDLQKTITQKEAEVATLTQMYKSGHPIHTAALKQLEELRAGLDRLISKAAEEVTNAYDSATATEKKMEDAVEEQERIALQQGKTSILYNVLRQEAESDRALYESVLTRLKQTDVAKDAAQDEVRVVSHPLLPERPVAPDNKQVLLLSILGGLIAGCGLSLLSTALDASIKTVEDAEGQLGLPALGVIPKWARPKWLTDDLLLLERPGCATAESFRTLRTSLMLLGKNAGRKVFLFTSAAPSEGKSFCAINSAVAFAQQGLRTLLIDADLRSPSIDKIFFDGSPCEGLTDALRHETDLEDAVRKSNINGLFVLCAGSPVGMPAELLGSEVFGEIMQEARAKFDCVIVDSAPVRSVSDTLLLIQHVELTCLVVAAQTSSEAAVQAVHKLTKAGAALTGFILNRVARQRLDASYEYRYPCVDGAHVQVGGNKKVPKPSPQLEGPVFQE